MENEKRLFYKNIVRFCFFISAIYFVYYIYILGEDKLQKVKEAFSDKQELLCANNIITSKNFYLEDNLLYVSNGKDRYALNICIISE